LLKFHFAFGVKQAIIVFGKGFFNTPLVLIMVLMELINHDFLLQYRYLKHGLTAKSFSVPLYQYQLVSQ
jgi:hypothetical protein